MTHCFCHSAVMLTIVIQTYLANPHHRDHSSNSIPVGSIGSSIFAISYLRRPWQTTISGLGDKIRVYLFNTHSRFNLCHSLIYSFKWLGLVASASSKFFCSQSLKIFGSWRSSSGKWVSKVPQAKCFELVTHICGTTYTHTYSETEKQSVRQTKIDDDRIM
jgi:hypothetical protein